ncbi:hypothetical protein [Microbacterium lacticum]|uniref:hypothetical protein n=1 Tax=Microbacterium lacticum TaxID=33885 RepID=UPI001F5714D7|nr:hypothetical protein [Microbacterium lacticum]
MNQTVLSDGDSPSMKQTLHEVHAPAKRNFCADASAPCVPRRRDVDHADSDQVGVHPCFDQRAYRKRMPLAVLTSTVVDSVDGGLAADAEVGSV